MRLTYLNTIILSIPFANTTGIQISVIWGVFPPHKKKKKKRKVKWTNRFIMNGGFPPNHLPTR